MGVAVGAEDFENPVGERQNRAIEGPAAEVVDGNGAGVRLIEAVSERRRSRFVDDAQHIQPGDAPGIAGRLALGVVEIRGHRDHGLRWVPGALPDFPQYHRAEFFGRVFLVVDPNAQNLPPGLDFAFDDLLGDVLQFRAEIGERPAHQPLDAENGVRRIEQRPLLRGAADEHRAVRMKTDARRDECDARAVAEDLRPAVAHRRREAVRRAEIDADDGGGRGGFHPVLVVNGVGLSIGSGGRAPFRNRSPHRQSPITSPPARVPMARHVAGEMELLIDRTEPSIRRVFTKFVW